MTYDATVRHDLTTILGAGETSGEDIDRAIPPLTLKTENGRFAKVGRSCMVCGRSEDGGICGPWIYRIIEDPS
jgi:hypothetical protein